MPTSAPGSKAPATTALAAARAARRGFTLLELLIVLAIVAVTAGFARLALRDGTATRLERDAVRLAALLEMARAESRVSGTTVRWVPGGGVADPAAVRSAEPAPKAFQFLGLGAKTQLPSAWLDDRVNARVEGATFVVLGPEAILPRQRVLLRLEDQQIEVASDGLGPFAVNGLGTSDATPAGRP
jgi:general secretion pathway protein H